MKFLPFYLKITLLLVAPMVWFSSCDENDTEPETARIHGTITLDSAQLWNTWKDSGIVQVALFPGFVLAPPPAGSGWGPIPDNFFGPGVPGGTYAIGAPTHTMDIPYAAGTTEIHYSLEVEPGTYSALALGFRHNTITDPSLRTASLGVHWDNPTTVSHGVVIKMAIGGGQVITLFDEPAPSDFILAKGDNVEINFRADFSFVNEWYQ